MNAHVFNTTAEELRTSIYGYNADNLELQQIQVNENGEILVASEGMDILVTGNRFVDNSATVTEAAVGSEGTVLAGTDISQLKTATMFVFNTGPGTITVTLQLSPGDDMYLDDPSYTGLTIAAGSSEVIVLGTFASAAQLTYLVGDEIATFTAYFNGQA